MGPHFPAKVAKSDWVLFKIKPPGVLKRIHRIHRKRNTPCRTDPGFPTPGGRMTVVYTNSLKQILQVSAIWVIWVLFPISIFQTLVEFRTAAIWRILVLVGSCILGVLDILWVIWQAIDAFTLFFEFFTFTFVPASVRISLHHVGYSFVFICFETKLPNLNFEEIYKIQYCFLGGFKGPRKLIFSCGSVSFNLSPF